MKSTIYYGKEDIRVEERPLPVVGRADVLVKNLRAGICGTDIGIYNFGGELFNVASGDEIGHEMVGEVVEIGPDVSPEITLWMRVFVNPCTAKRSGLAKANAASGFSEYVLVEDAKLNYNIYEIAPSIPAEAAVLVEPLSVGTHGAFHLQPQVGEKVVVLGGGTIGMSAAASLIAEGIKQVCIVDIDDWRLEKAASLGALTLNSKNEDLAQGLINRFGSQTNLLGMQVPDVDLYVDAAGAPALLKGVIAMAKPKSRLSIIATYKQEVAIHPAMIMMNEFRMEGSCGYTHENITQVISHLTEQKTNIDEIVTHVFKLDQIDEAFKVATQAKEAIKVIIDLT
ncbi:zinc-dependent alcohol dehydrogenase [Cohnella abietis]|uniref:Threonine dehydrogenase n=1 Tax=Cohnella abietis TaxID=2507935 RepID=A0A3T1D6S6_9BACL|nr:zinc-binding dehydrogenase [Cohnella abietis]BBI33788.1 threonine dehydrogenase [Cohnella abietis]